MARAVQADAIRILSPLQVGVGIPAGCEAIVHSLSIIFHGHSSPESRCSLLVDFSNAFNSIDRGLLFLEARARIPAISAWLECCYGFQPLLFLGDHTILSCLGVQQRDPLGPLAFALALHPLVEQIKQGVPGLWLNSWYLDDGTLCGSPADISSALSLLKAGGPPRGLSLTQRKCLQIVPEDATCNQSLIPSESPVSSGGFVLFRVSLWLQLLLHFGCAKEGREDPGHSACIEVTSGFPDPVHIASRLPRPPKNLLCPPYLCPASHPTCVGGF